jgi:uncharacterized protein (TIGR00255 family)
MKSVNHRYLDISVKLPKQLSFLEEEMKKQIASQIKRGKIDVFVTFDNRSGEGKSISINQELAQMYIEQLRNLARKENLQANIEVTEISKFPDVLNIKMEQEDEVIKQEVIQTVNQAISGLVEMRTIEGQKMAQDLITRIEAVEDEVQKISSQSTGLIDNYVVKLEERIKEILQTDEIDQARLAQEVVIYADKSSIEEEITRLKSHVSQFKSLLQANEPVGKKLDFIIQEMNRETNTIGSKANCLAITNGVIDIKTELENIREQVQNIE